MYIFSSIFLKTFNLSSLNLQCYEKKANKLFFHASFNILICILLWLGITTYNIALSSRHALLLLRCSSYVAIWLILKWITIDFVCIRYFLKSLSCAKCRRVCDRSTCLMYAYALLVLRAKYRFVFLFYFIASSIHSDTSAKNEIHFVSYQKCKANQVIIATKRLF